MPMLARPLVLSAMAASAPAQEAQAPVPPRGGWEFCPPEAAGFDPERLQRALAHARSHPTDWPRNFATQQAMFGRQLGPLPDRRGGTNVVIVRGGRLVVADGEVDRADPAYSIAGSLLATVAGIAVRDGLIDNLDAPVGRLVQDGGYDSAHNALVTWRHHLQQTSEWDGAVWSKSHDFVAADEFGAAQRPPRELRPPGTWFECNDVRADRLALSLLLVFGRSLPEVCRSEVMDPIGATPTWRWVPYRDAFVEAGGRRLPAVPGGSRFGGGVWISSLDLARLGLLWLRGGIWGDRRILPESFVRQALEPGDGSNDHGFLLWLNRQQRNWPGVPPDCFGARGEGCSTVFVAPGHDLVVVWRWHGDDEDTAATFFRLVLEAAESRPAADRRSGR